ncbi:hypothetical protein [Leuconostoc inhae]|uniref:hypothetical protein n=1 Tax=Leuconostoc inhae TaxID=178001 RepID=UPI001C7D40C4|nr:hypothetical protein [Leuconostoc inhae]
MTKVNHKGSAALGNISNKIPLKATKYLGTKTRRFNNHSETIKEEATIELEDEFDKMVQPIFGSSVSEIASNIIDNLTTPREIIYAMDDESNDLRIFVGKSI